MYFCIHLSGPDAPHLSLTLRQSRTPGTRIIPTACIAALQQIRPNQQVYLFLPPTDRLLEGDEPVFFLSIDESITYFKTLLLNSGGFIKRPDTKADATDKFIFPLATRFDQSMSDALACGQRLMLFSEDQELLGIATSLVWSFPVESFDFEHSEPAL